ncbi:DUF1240 domain-containing protein [Xenorhabdus innexi]|uniref:Membrane protein n=1 Tax=Xenorhabdus innexi TaxID=290109 RepID=A0A2G0N2V0_9GAMM|nr:DUF1240 domain-containing protein [Xenorhabdus innexi]PHM29067.1 membrane protein [Xenorhabdus innexi]
MSNVISSKGLLDIPFWKKILYVLTSLVCLFGLLFVVFDSWKDLVSLINLDERVYFSWRIFLLCFGFPIAFHMFFSVILICFVSNSKEFINYLFKIFTRLFFVVFILSFPVSLYSDYKLKSFGYLTCSKKSWVAPNEYVRNIKLCY